MDPAQRKMMAFMMPVILGFMCWHFASGLALYWGTGNVINLAIQLGINQSGWARRCTLSPPGGPPRRPAAPEDHSGQAVKLRFAIAPRSGPPERGFFCIGMVRGAAAMAK